ncbi:hypothetical protein D8674_001484 [Pyrus ussuriensis x Pyrus communis]|uniref:TPX2 central domain-containing protein n=1 Tax=Pyrus ussuriensis x Pyrus communis TaxID=2448454 RepID=A0A5N5FJQ3_9ROSA|nr:hypothetical protein D8674_001484 [Pyrus ussuriensis x Pyrus communis]
MDEEMVEFAREAFEGDEIDMDYEFDAPKFYDFTRPESDWEAEEAEEWFRSAGGYQPSPFLEKLLNWQKENHPVPIKTSAESKDVEITRCSNSNKTSAEVSASVDDNDKEFSNHMAQDTPKTKLKSPGKSPHLSRSSTLMKPTASQLAKQNHQREVHSNRLLRRVAKKLGKLYEKSQNSPPPTKRQKLEAGYVRKVAEQLKHQPLWLHKAAKKVGADAARPKVTVPKEPNLETANRAQRRRYKFNAKPGEQSKIHRAPPWPSPKKSTIPAAEFQVTNGPDSSNLSENETTEIKGPNSVHALKQEKSEMIYKCVACSLKNKELKFAIEKRCLKEPPTDLFSKVFCLVHWKGSNCMIKWSAGPAHKVLERIRVLPRGHELGQIVLSKLILS